MMAWFSGCLIRAIPTDRRHSLLGRSARASSSPVNPYAAPTGAGGNRRTPTTCAGGTVYPMRPCARSATARTSAACKVHMDGARIFNASGRSGHARARDCCSRRYGDVLSLQRTGCARRLHTRRTRRRSSIKAASTASVWAAECARPASSPPPVSSPWSESPAKLRRRPCQRALPGRRPGAHPRDSDRPREGRNQYRRLRCLGHRPCARRYQRRSAAAAACS